jgi:hypothetical protein
MVDIKVAQFFRPNPRTGRCDLCGRMDSRRMDVGMLTVNQVCGRCLMAAALAVLNAEYWSLPYD